MTPHRSLRLPARWRNDLALTATISGLAVRTIDWYASHGLTAVQADNLACSMGYHPYEIWGDAYDRAEDLYAARHVKPPIAPCVDCGKIPNDRLRVGRCGTCYNRSLRAMKRGVQ